MYSQSHHARHAHRITEEVLKMDTDNKEVMKNQVISVNKLVSDSKDRTLMVDISTTENHLVALAKV